MKPLSSAHARVAVWCIVSFRWWTSVPLRVRYGLLFQCMLELVCNFLTVLRRHQTPTDGHAHTLYETNTKLTFYWVRYETRRGYGDFYTVCEALPKRPPHSESHLLSITHPSQRAYIISSESASGCALGAWTGHVKETTAMVVLRRSASAVLYLAPPLVGPEAGQCPARA